MATATAAPPAPEAPPVAESPGVDSAPIDRPKLPDGFVRLSDVRPNSRKSDEYAALRPFVGKLIQLEELSFGTRQIKVKGEDGAETEKTVPAGRMVFSEYGVETAQSISCPIPQATVKSLQTVAGAVSGQTIVCEVVQLKRGIALR
jgi:hypothetical protein